MSIIRLSIAPLSKVVRRQLEADARDVAATLKRKGLDSDSAPRSVDVSHREIFELGCWLKYYSGRVRTRGTAARIDCVRRLFEAGVPNPGGEFHGLFDFGSRDFDACFENGDGDRVVDALLQLAAESPDSALARCVSQYKWTRSATAQTALF